MRGHRWMQAVVGVGLLAAGHAAARAADQIVLGQTILIKNPVPGKLTDRYFKFSAREKAGATVVGDPTIGGATLRVIANGGTPSDETYTLPAVGWRKRTTSIGYVSYRFRELGLNQPVKLLEIKLTKPGGTFSIRAGATAKLSPINVIPPTPGTDAAIVLAIVGGDTYCVGFGGAAGGMLTNEPSGNPFKVFGVRRPSAEIGACPP